ncbi:MAG: PAS domain-containing protein [Thiotrichales bacterium]|nr:PAS domain-containing protein [Thiotrichales bacterium]
MRDNGPITNNEYVLAKGTSIVSRTDLHGNIIAANEAFVEASGFDWQELVGQPHNMLRHPDVPPAVFKDFWATIQAGKPWSQIVKNRRKNGDHYWVVANATPIFENGEIVGFMSVRTPATTEQKTAAAEAYKAIEAGSITLKNGEIETFASRFNVLNNLNPSLIISFLSGLLLASIFLSNLFDTGISDIAFEVFDVAIVLLIFLTTYLGSKRMAKIAGLITSISEGKFDNEIQTSGKNLIGQIMSRLKSMQIKLGADFDDVNAALNNAKRIESALNAASSNIMVADRFRSIIFMNNAVKNMLKEIESEVQTVLPEFKADNLVRQSIDIFHKDSHHQENILDKLTTTFNTRIVMGSETVDLIVDPIFDDQGRRIGTVAEWKRITEQLAVENMIADIVANAAKGELSVRIDTAHLSGFEQRLSVSINTLLESFTDITSNLNVVLAKTSEGDLSHQLSGNYEGQMRTIQVAVNNALANIAMTFSKVKNGSSEIGNMATEVAVASEDLSQRTQHQAASLEETAASMEQITSTIQMSSDNTLKANELSHQSAQEAREAMNIMHKTIQAMNGIEALSKQIGEITHVIDSIAFQTNLLALNAAVEAARAGEHGRGFAVVAGEVRNLAQKSAESSKEISNLISSATSQIQSGTKLVEQTNGVFETMVIKINEVETLVSEIATSSQEQAKGLSQINIAVTNLDEVTQQNAALVEELSATAGNMSDEAKSQAEFVGRFELGKYNKKQQKSMHNIDFTDAKMQHNAWNIKLEQLLNNQATDINKETARLDNQCSLGKWLYSEGKQFASLPAMQTLLTQHQEFHATIGRVIDAKALGDDELAKVEKVKAYQLSQELMVDIDELEEALNNTSPSSHAQFTSKQSVTQPRTEPRAVPSSVPKSTPAKSAPIKPAQTHSTPIKTAPSRAVAAPAADEWSEF